MTKKFVSEIEQESTGIQVFSSLSALKATGTTAQYKRGDQTWRDFATDVRGTVLTGLTSQNAGIAANDTVLVALGKAQGQLSALQAAKSNLTVLAYSVELSHFLLVHIPAVAKRVTIDFWDCASTSELCVQIGSTTLGVVYEGYIGSRCDVNDGAQAVYQNTDGFHIAGGPIMSGRMVLEKIHDQAIVVTGHNAAGGQHQWCAGRCWLPSGVWNCIQFRDLAGVSLTGAVTVTWE